MLYINKHLFLFFWKWAMVPDGFKMNIRSSVYFLLECKFNLKKGSQWIPLANGLIVRTLANLVYDHSVDFEFSKTSIKVHRKDFDEHNVFMALMECWVVWTALNSFFCWQVWLATSVEFFTRKILLFTYYQQKHCLSTEITDKLRIFFWTFLGRLLVCSPLWR